MVVLSRRGVGVWGGEGGGMTYQRAPLEREGALQQLKQNDTQAPAAKLEPSQGSCDIPHRITWGTTQIFLLNIRDNLGSQIYLS